MGEEIYVTSGEKSFSRDKDCVYKYKDDYFPTITYTSLQANYH